jgi:hypothetical protein
MKRNAALAMLIATVALAACGREERTAGDSSAAGTVPPSAARDSAPIDSAKPDSIKPDSAKHDTAGVPKP